MSLALQLCELFVGRDHVSCAFVLTTAPFTQHVQQGEEISKECVQ